MSTQPHADEVLVERVSQLSLDDKVRLLTGADSWSLHPQPSIGLRRVVVSDGPAGVRGEAWDERDPSATIPSPTALAATWEPARIERIGSLLAAEARRKGVDVLLAPTVNLHRTPYGGRHFECFSEDPLLTGVIGAAFVRGVQGGGVGATVKHFVANDSETDRFTYDARVDERVLRELYLLPFEIIVREAGVWAVMAAYNSVNGATMTESPLLREVLKDEWGFDGVVMSDWHAGRSLAAAGEGLLDLVMPGPDGPWGPDLTAAVRDGRVAAHAIDDKVVRLLRLAARTGALQGAWTAPPKPSTWSATAVSAELRAAAAASFVLARNTGVLPLQSGGLRRVAVLGPNAATARVLGGGSATVFPPYVVSPLQGLREGLGEGVEVLHGAGGRVGDRVPVAPVDLLTLPDGSGPGIEVRFIGADGRVLATEHRRGAHLIWSGAITVGVAVSDVAAVELRTRLRAPRSGTYRIGGSGLGAFRLTVDGRTVVDGSASLAPGGDAVEGMMRPPQATAVVELPDGEAVDVVLHHAPAAVPVSFGEGHSSLTVQLNLEPDSDDAAAIEHAVARAAGADVAVVVVGTTEDVESEGFDRADLSLPGRQDELVRRVAAANPHTVVVVNAGAPVLLPWADDVAAVVLAWFPGQEFGNALADVLLGRMEPGGRLPTTWPLDDGGHPSVRPEDGLLHYDEGLFIGYRRGDGARPVRYPFGHGLGYTDWAYDDLQAPSGVASGADVTVRLAVRNTGARAGREVVQLYVSRPASSLPRPARWLAGFAVIEAAPGATAEAAVQIAPRTFEHWDPERGWTVEPGDFVIEAGRSVADLRCRTSITVSAPDGAP